jgi:hypothetical protein
VFKKTVAIVTMALVAMPAAGQAASKKDMAWDASEPICVPVAVSTGTQNIHVGSHSFHVPGIRDPKVCLTSDTKLNGTPTVTPYSNCGILCFALRVTDFNISEDLRVELSYQTDGKSQTVSLHPDPIDVGRDLEEVCVSNHDPGTPDPCVITLTSPTDLKVKGGKRQLSLNWTPAGEAYGRNVQTTYEVWRSMGTELATFEMIASGVTETSFLDTGLARRTTYSYFVVAVDAEDNRSGGSNVARATT